MVNNGYLVALALAVTAAAQSATVVVFTLSSAAGQSNPYIGQNTTLSVPLGTNYTSVYLSQVSTFYFAGAIGVPVDAVNCQGWDINSGFFPPNTGPHHAGLPFNSSSTASYLTTQIAVSVDYIVCSDTRSSSATRSNSTGSASPSGSGRNVLPSTFSIAPAPSPITPQGTTTASAAAVTDVAGLCAALFGIGGTMLVL